MGLASEDSFVWVRSYFHRLLLEPDRAAHILVAKDDFVGAKTALQQCRDAAALNAWLEQYARADAQLRCRNALYQRKCSQGLQRLSLKKTLHRALMALAAERGDTLNQTVEYLLGLHRDNQALATKTSSGHTRPVPNLPAARAEPAETPTDDEEDAYREQMILWAMSRSTGRTDET